MGANPQGPVAATATPRDAIIFIPGIGHEWVDQSVDGIAKRIATAMDRGAQNPGARFRLEGHDEDYREGFKTRVCTITRSDTGKDDHPCLDIYGMDYRDVLTQRFATKTPLVKSWLVCWAILRNSLKLRRLFVDSAKSPREKLQIVYVQAVLALLGIYLCLLIGAVIGTVQQLPESLSNPSQAAAVTQPAASASSDKAGGRTEDNKSNWPWRAIWSRAARWSAMVIVLLNALLFVAPPKIAWKDFVSRTATEYLCMIYYFSAGERRNVILGQLEALLEHVAEKDKISYRSIHFVTYSFGTVVALDALFDALRKPNTRFARVHTLVTIGCPFDMVRLFWPRYFDQRETLPGHPQRWLNVYSPLDVLSSNFRDDARLAQAEKTIGLRDGIASGAAPKPENLPFRTSATSDVLSFLDLLMLEGLRAHSMYWEASFESEISCFHDVVASMYQGDALLA